MINTMNNIVTTNLRVPADDMMQYKMMAEEMGMSFNEYVNRIMKEVTQTKMIVGDLIVLKNKRKMSFMDIVDIKIKKDKPMGLSDDDMIIYG
ncbi:hypothetical protein CO009_02060 [Candidatus Shapirobacteria bacterium CG_4_8_14_3_um_filter_35_11]|uniref:Ribbon-helix-helix protein CopG domain-containing protein n=5 Tax=Candidatus Shapironibacteriota TaxID=1752721 RepID=A0A1J5I9A5_9BACT|nr:MAG: hypothetical protein AUK05_00310 [Candidatus Shapirobacteria bacterium CG2_30_35_20]PIV07546.1 MAG: hypothetical protein COS53_01865 [Candidatus Shapirobacteria bacterium CG03_land_8_20_14_0_80_35_14]PJA50808.1 MAG: hypothetical protein CO168_03125 [Candidatus Shapirobacteria bacterium CG_4_9_14_3_um_filter_36_12]PJC80374.1 MAG: hypothetical protein CO009_02060 [Candidatus Shapirobacteria bacterium CG_4_8_14_3_um_filter_35_11]PJE67009.1 MAG: hypothetical protein COU93_01155 [Candidatus 